MVVPDIHRFKDFDQWLRAGMKWIPMEMAASVEGCAYA